MRSSTLVSKIVHTIQSIAIDPKTNEINQTIHLHEPLFQGNEWKYVKECLGSTFVSSIGRFVDQFEQQIVEFTGANYAIAVVNGTAALQIALQIVGVQPNDEVLIPTLTFVATANAVHYCGAIPHFVDSDEVSLGMNPEKLMQYLSNIAEIKEDQCFNKKTGRRIKALVPMHTFGHPVDLDPIIELCSKYHLQLVEDAAESLGSYYKGRHTGTIGKVGVISFNGNKIITTGGGGAILTNDEHLARRAKHLTTTAKIPHTWNYFHDEIGYNYRMPNLNAALGCAQIEQLPMILQWKRQLANSYQEAFQGTKHVKMFREPTYSKSNYWLNVLLLDEEVHELQDLILMETNRQGIRTRPAWKLMHQLGIYKDSPKMDLSVAESLEKRIINLPSSPILTVRKK